MIIPAGRAPEVCGTADVVLRANAHRIRAGRLDGRHWAVFCYDRAGEIVSRRRAAEHRRTTA